MPLDVFAEANRFVAEEEGHRIVTIGATRYPIIAARTRLVFSQRLG